MVSLAHQNQIIQDQWLKQLKMCNEKYCISRNFGMELNLVIHKITKLKSHQFLIFEIVTFAIYFVLFAVDVDFIAFTENSSWIRQSSRNITKIGIYCKHANKMVAVASWSCWSKTVVNNSL